MAASNVRCIRFGKLSASYERRDGEHIYAAMLTLAELPSKPLSTKISDGLLKDAP
jgi:hypothetical protein